MLTIKKIVNKIEQKLANDGAKSREKIGVNFLNQPILLAFIVKKSIPFRTLLLTTLSQYR